MQLSGQVVASCQTGITSRVGIIMKVQTLITVLATAGAIALNATTTLGQSSLEQDVRFICDTSRKGNIPLRTPEPHAAKSL
jgi:hypothetical protein